MLNYQRVVNFDGGLLGFFLSFMMEPLSHQQKSMGIYEGFLSPKMEVEW